MTANNYYINTDHDGKCPSLTFKNPDREYYTQYVNDRPVKVAPYIGQDRVWDYDKGDMLALNSDTHLTDYTGKPMKVYKGIVIHNNK